jgi:hypothetical protein
MYSKKDFQLLLIMRRFLLLTLLLYMSVLIIVAQDYHPGNEKLLVSGLPLVEIVTEGGEEPTCEAILAPQGCMGVGITNKTKVPSRMTITQGEELLYDSGEYEKDGSGLLLSIRGNTSAALSPKKPYKIKLQKKADLLFRGDNFYNDKEWGLLKCEYGKFMHSLVGFKVNEMAGLQWTPHFMYVNVVINGDYKGVYMLMETVKNSKSRLSVDKNSGYIIEYDAYWWNEDLCLPAGKFFKWNSMRYTFKYPDADDITQEQTDFIQGRVEEMESSITAGTYDQYIDVPSFAAWLLAQDILGNGDGCGSNIFLTLYDSGEETKFQMGNIWDMDGIEETVDFWAAVHYIYGFYFEWLFGSDNKMFMETYKNQWSELSPILVDEMIRFLDDFSNSEQGLGIAACMQYDAHRWGYASGTLSTEIDKHKRWFTNRKHWLDEQSADIRSPWKIYTASFDNGGVWEKVYAYVQNKKGKAVLKPLGDWPGMELRKNEETGLYIVTITDIRIPESIIFSDGTIEENSVIGVNKTETYEFVNDKVYTFDIQLAIRNIQQKEQRESIIYNLTGQRVKKAEKGLFIINGKVVLVK